jgi:restriction endonuclease Mrr
VKDRLREVDWALLSDGRSIHWRNTAQWAHHKLVQAGLLASDSRRGVWEVAEAGQVYLRERRPKLM